MAAHRARALHRAATGLACSSVLRGTRLPFAAAWPCSAGRLLWRDYSTAGGRDETRLPRHPLTQSSSDADFRAKYASRATRDSDRLATDLDELDVFGGIAPPSTAVHACLEDGFAFENGVRIAGGEGALLVDGEVFRWKPWETTEGGKAAMLDPKGRFDVPEAAWGLLKVLWPKPDLLILGLGAANRPLSPETRQHITSLGIRIDAMDTRNAAAQYNMLATERGVGDVAAALLPIGWTGKAGA